MSNIVPFHRHPRRRARRISPLALPALMPALMFGFWMRVLK